MRGKETMERVLCAAGIPQDAIDDCPRVTITGRTSVTIEGQRGVVELSEARIRLKTGSGVLAVSGSGLRLETLSPEKAVVTGNVIDEASFR